MAETDLAGDEEFGFHIGMSLWVTKLANSARHRGGRLMPCICMQGGGAKGAWQAGVLSHLLRSDVLVAPAAVWGTSAGAVNALWATDCNADIQNRLLKNWKSLAERIRVLLFLMASLGFGSAKLMWCFVGCFWTIGLGTAAILAYIVCGCLGKRLPGLIPICLASRVLPRASESAPWCRYYCTACVSSDAPRREWSYDGLGTWMQKSNKRRAELLSDGSMWTPREPVMASAGLPIACRPLHHEGKDYMDGGLVANLPAEFATPNGTLGADLIIAIVPVPIHDLNSNNRIDNNVLRLLSSIRDVQSKSRQRCAEAFKTGEVWNGPPITHFPVLVISPREALASGTINGFLEPGALEPEFYDGIDVAKKATDSIREFIKTQSGSSLDGFALETLKLPVAGILPRYEWWRFWVNRSW